MTDFHLVIKATLQIYVECAKLATTWFLINWIVPLASVGLFIVFVLSAGIFLNLGMAGGFIMGIISSLFTAQYYSWLRDTVQKDRIKPQNLADFDASMFFSVIGVSFILFIVHYLTAPMGRDNETLPVLYIIYFFIMFAFNVLPEVIYINRYDSTHAFTEALKFTKENWIEWYLPFVIFITPGLLLVEHFEILLLKFALLSPLFPGVMILNVWSLLVPLPYVGALIGFLLCHWYMLFRGFLFKELSSGSRRRRVYLAKQK